MVFRRLIANQAITERHSPIPLERKVGRWLQVVVNTQENLAQSERRWKKGPNPANTKGDIGNYLIEIVDAKRNLMLQAASRLA